MCSVRVKVGRVLSEPFKPTTNCLFDKIFRTILHTKGVLTVFVFSEYHIDYSEKTFTEAKAFCNSLGQKLFEPKNLQANNEVAELAKTAGITGELWIGIHDISNEGNFIYDSSDATIMYENWGPGEPNDIGSGEDCTTLRSNGSYWAPGTWNDQPCWRKFPFVCEKSGKSASYGDDLRTKL